MVLPAHALFDGAVLVVRQPLTYLLGMNQDQFNAVSSLLYGSVRDYSNGQLQMAQDVFLRHDEIVSAIPELSNMPSSTLPSWG